MIRPALLALTFAALLAAPAQATTPQDLLDRFDEIVAQNGGLGVDAEITAALATARAEGPLDPDWARVMMVGAVQVMAGLARHERGFALLHEAEALAPSGSDLEQQIIAWRAYFEFWWGQADHGRATLSRLHRSAQDILPKEQAAYVAAHATAADDMPGSDGFTHASELLLTTADLIASGDIDQATAILRGLRMPEAEARRHPLVASYNASISLNLALAARVLGEDASARAHFVQAVADLSTEESAPRLRPDLFDEPSMRQGNTDILILILTLSDAEADAELRATINTALEPLLQESPALRASLALQLARQAREEHHDWAASAAHIQTALATGTLEPDEAAGWAAYGEAMRAFAAIEAGQPIDHASIAAAYRKIADATGLQPIVRIARSADLVNALYLGDVPLAANILGRGLFAQLDAMQRNSDLSGATMAAMAAYWKEAASATIDAGFMLALSPIDGQPAPQQHCQEFLEIELCTAHLQ